MSELGNVSSIHAFTVDRIAHCPCVETTDTYIHPYRYMLGACADSEVCWACFHRVTDRLGNADLGNVKQFGLLRKAIHHVPGHPDTRTVGLICAGRRQSVSCSVPDIGASSVSSARDFLLPGFARRSGNRLPRANRGLSPECISNTSISSHRTADRKVHHCLFVRDLALY